MSPQMKKRVFNAEDKLIKKLDEGKKEGISKIYSGQMYMMCRDFAVPQQLQKSHSVYYV